MIYFWYARACRFRSRVSFELQLVIRQMRRSCAHYMRTRRYKRVCDETNKLLKNAKTDADLYRAIGKTWEIRALLNEHTVRQQALLEGIPRL